MVRKWQLQRVRTHEGVFDPFLQRAFCSGKSHIGAPPLVHCLSYIAAMLKVFHLPLGPIAALVTASTEDFKTEECVHKPSFANLH
jgi:hypothetical protein